MAQGTKSQIATLIQDSVFQSKIAVAVFQYATYILTASPPFAFNKIQWARNAYTNPGGEAAKFYTAVAFDGTISDAGVLSAATDGQIQSALEAVVNTYLATTTF